MELEIRNARIADAPTVIAFNSSMARETENIQLDGAVLEDGVLTVLSDPSLGRYFVALRDGEIVGQMLITYEWSDWRNGLIWWIQSVYVAPAARRRGVYRQLHDHAKKQAMEMENVVGIRLYVEKENQVAQSVYRQVGMSPTSYLMFEECWTNAPKKD